MKSFVIKLLVSSCLALPIGPATGIADELTVFAAASLKEALDEVIESYEDKQNVDVAVSYAGSSALARQIEFGAPADLFISANLAWMDRLEQANKILPGSRIDLLGNRLVLIGHPDHPSDAVSLSEPDFAQALGTGRLAMALYDAVPAGIYGKAALEDLGLWHGIEDRIAQTDNVRSAMALVAIKAAPLGIVYETDAKADPRVTVLATFPDASHPKITYPAAIVHNENTVGAEAFLNFLQSIDARNVFDRYGFLRPVEG